MDKLLYWASCDKTITETLPWSGKKIEHHIKMEFKCSHPKILKVWFWGGGTATGPMKNYIEMIGENGERYSQEVTDEEMQSGVIPKAEEWLQSLPTN